jgi:pyruvate/2-oxoglutarate dehydrogenase complex dihydrolipoamide acyltransferase (E2) component
MIFGFQENVKLGPALKISSWRRVAIGTWARPRDPQVYGSVEIEAEPVLRLIEKLRKQTKQHITLTHVVGKIMGIVLSKHPELNCILRFGRLFPRKEVDVFFQVASDNTGEDLSGVTIRNVDQKTVIQIAEEMASRVVAVKTKKDTSYKKIKQVFGLIPGWFARPMLGLAGFLQYDLNLWSPMLGSPRDAFGSVMITNIGSLGISMAYAPLVGYSRGPVIITIGGVSEKPVVKNGQIVVGKILALTVTIDHRVIDGVQGGNMFKTFMAAFKEPEKYLI